MRGSRYKYIIFQNSAGDQLIPAGVLAAEYRSVSATPGAQDTRVPTYPVEDTAYTYALGWRTGTYKGEQKKHTNFNT